MNELPRSNQMKIRLYSGGYNLTSNNYQLVAGHAVGNLESIGQNDVVICELYDVYYCREYNSRW